MRRLALALFLGLGGSVVAQTPATAPSQAAPSQAAKVSFTCRAQRADRMLEALSAAANVHLETTPVMAGEIVIVSAKDVPLTDLLARIATATSGEWKTIDGGGYRLVQSSSIRNQEERQAVAERVAALKKSIQSHLVKPPASKGGDAPAKATPEEMDFTPGDQTLYTIISRTDLDAIAKLGTGDRIVFSTRPTRMQRPFSGDISTEIATMVKEHNAGVTKTDGKTDAQLDEMPEFVKKMVDKMSKPIGSVSKVLLVVSRMSFASFGMMQTELRIYDPQGKVAFTQPGMIDLPGLGLETLTEEMGVQLPGSKPVAKPANPTPVEMSPDTVEIEKVFQGSGMQVLKGLTMPPAVKQKLFHPDQYDPLSFLATDQVFALAKKRGVPAVAVLPDDAVSMLSMVMSNQKPTVEDYERTLSKAATIRQVPDDGWLVIKPTHPAEARLNRLDRTALAGLMATAEAKGVPSLDDVAAYSLKAPSPLEGGLGQLYVLYFVPGVFSQGLSGFTSWETLRFYGSLDPSARNTLASGGRIAFNNLTPYQQEQVRKMVFGSTPSLEVDDPGKKPDDSAMPGILKTFMGGGGDDYREEPTEILPNGLPTDGFVFVKVSTEPFALPVVADGETIPGTTGIMDADMFATFKMMKETPSFSQIAGMFPTPDRLRLGERSVIAFTFQVAPNVAAHQKLNDHRVAKDAPIITADNLPAGFQKLIAERTEALKKSPFGAFSSLMGTAGAKIKP